MTRPPLPPFNEQTAIEKIRLAEDGWNTRDAARVAQAYTIDTRWRNRTEFVTDREGAQAFLTRKWNRELDYRLIKELWAFTPAIALRCAMPMNIVMTAASGSVLTAMKTGNMPMTG